MNDHKQLTCFTKITLNHLFFFFVICESPISIFNIICNNMYAFE